MSYAPSSALSRRHRAIRQEIGRRSLDALVVTSLPNIVYLTNFTGSSAIVVVTPDRLYFITDFPTAVKSQTFYARRIDDHPELTGYFDLEFRGLEIASGGPREHRIDQLEANLRSAGLDPSAFSGYLESFRFGMPTHGGWGLGIDRLVQYLAGLPNVREARLFPRDRYRLEP